MDVQSSKRSPAYEDGADAARRTGRYAAPDADVRCPFETETPESDDWWRGFNDVKAAQARHSSPTG